MKYRIFKNETKISQMGLGFMRLPVIDGDNARIDEEKAEEMALYAYENGVNYFDSAYAYHGHMSEKFVGKIVQKNNLRDKVYLATKMPVWLAKAPEDYDRLLDEQLANLQTDYVDFYLLHSLGAGFWNNVEKQELFAFMERAKRDGRVKNIGFSFHDNIPVFKQIIDAYTWDFCQIQLNYMDENYQAGIEGLKYAADKGIFVVIMEPLKGGRLGTMLSNTMQAVFDKNDVALKPAALAMKYLFDKSEVGCVLTGASTLEQLKENVATAKTCDVGDLTDNEKQAIQELEAFYNARTKVPCTGCLYCIDDCPQRIPINIVFSLYNGRYMYENDTMAKIQYYAHVSEARRPDQCLDCGICEERCPQGIAIREKLKEAQADLESI